MKEKFLLVTLAAILAFNQTKAQFNSITDCGAKGVGHSIYFMNPDTGFVAGEDNGGVIQRTMDGGNTWNRVYFYPYSAHWEWVEDICFANSTIGIAVGWYGTILRTIDGGTTWNRQVVSNVNRFNSVCFPTSTIGYAAGVGIPQGPIYKTIDGGINWTAQVSNADSSLQSIFFVDANTGYAFGGHDILKTTNGGTTWIRSNNNHPNTDSQPEHLEMYCTDANTCYLPGAVTQKTIDGGTTWNPLSMPLISPPYIYFTTAINFTNSLTGFAIGAVIDTANFTIVGTILKTIDAGQTWTNINTIANNDTLQNNRSLSSVKFVNSNVGYTTGAEGKVLKTANAGGLITTGIGSVSEKVSEIQIFPNPSSTDINFSIIGYNTIQRVELYDITGRMAKQVSGLNTQNFILQHEGLSSGLYITKITLNKGAITKKIIIE